MTTRTEKARIRQYVLDRYDTRNPRNIRIRKSGAVEARMVSEIGWQHGDDQVFCGWDRDLLDEIAMIDSVEAEDERLRKLGYL
jgi:hypothetical protein